MPKGGARIGAGRKPKTQRPVSFAGGLAVAPAWLSPAAKRQYQHYGRHLEAAGVITQVDRDALALFAATLAEIADLSRQINAKGFERVLRTEMVVKTNPLVTQYEKAKGQARQLAQDLGITPASRSRVQPTPTSTQEVKRDWRAVVYQMPAR